MSKYMLPLDVENDNTLSKWTLYDNVGVILAQYNREQTKDDRPMQRAYDGSLLVPPAYYGKWSPVSPATLATLNENKNIKVKKERTVPESYYDKRLREAKEMLTQKIKELEKLNEEEKEKMGE